MAYFDNLSNLPAGNTVLTNSIPQGFRPLTILRIKTTVGNGERHVLITFNKNNGGVSFYNYSSAATDTTPIYETLTYICAD